MNINLKNLYMQGVNLFFNKGSEMGKIDNQNAQFFQTKTQKIENQIRTDIANFKSEHRNLTSIQEEINKFVIDEQLFLDKDPEQIAKYEKRALSCYASSYMHYSPVVIEWAHAVLETAMAFDPPKRAVFLARDGIPPYEVAKILQKKYPEKYGQVPLSLLNMSRKVVDWAGANEENAQLFIDYVKQEGLKLDERCLFIDIGFYGSRIWQIKDLLKDLNLDIQFGYLVSHTPKAQGFMGNMTTTLESVKIVGSNPAVHWLEDTHQGVNNSPSRLFRDHTGIIRPYITDEKGSTTCKVAIPKSYLYKMFGLKAILDGANDMDLSTYYVSDLSTMPKQWNMATHKSKEAFDRFLKQYQNRDRISFTKHI